MFEVEKRVRRRVIVNKKKSLKQNLLMVIAFGLRIRGEFREDSDLTVVKKGDLDSISKIVEIFTNEELKTGIPCSPVVKSREIVSKEKEFKIGFFRNFINEDKILWGVEKVNPCYPIQT